MTIESQDLYKAGKSEYLELIKNNPEYNKYQFYAREADLMTEECLRQMSKGTDGVMKVGMYPIVFDIIFEDLIKRAK